MLIEFVSRDTHTQDAVTIDWFNINTTGEPELIGVVRPLPGHPSNDLPQIVDSDSYPINTDDAKNVQLKALLDYRVFTDKEFDAFLARPDWAREQATEFSECNEVEIPSEDNESLIETVYHFGARVLTSTLEGITVIFTESYSYYAEDPETFSASTEGLDKPLIVTGDFFIVDSDGDRRDPLDFVNCAENYPFMTIDYQDIVTSIKSCDQLEPPMADMETFELVVDHAPDLAFTGVLVGCAESAERNGRWVELQLYRTAGDKYVCYQVNYSRWVGERRLHKAKVVSGLSDQHVHAEIIDFFGHGWLAKDLYTATGIEDVTHLD